MSLFFVGVLNVDKMKFSFNERIQTNAMANFTQIYEYENLHIKKGERLGNFELGSTIVIFSLVKKIRPGAISLKTKSLNLLKRSAG